MHRKNFPNLTACFVMAAFLTMFPCLSLADEGIIAHDESSGRYTLDPEKMTEAVWKKLAQDDGLQAIVFMPYSDWRISKSQIRALKQLKNVRFVNFPRCQNIDVELLHALKTLPKLREVQLGSCQNYSAEVYHELSSMAQLEELYLYGGFLTEEGMASVCRLDNLKKLTISTRQELTSRQIGMLKDFENLRFLKIQNALISDRTLQAFGKILSLEELHLSWMGEFATTISSEKPVPVSPEELAVAGNITGAEMPASDSEPITREGIQGLASLRNLRVLTLSLPSRTVNGELAPLFTMTSLECLALEGEYRDQDICDIDQLANLKELFLYSFLMTGEAVKPLAKLKQLQELKLVFAPDAPDASEHLALLSSLNLRLINLSGNPCISDRVVPVLAKFPHLEYIDLSGTNVKKRNRRVFEEGDVPVKVLFKKRIKSNTNGK